MVLRYPLRPLSLEEIQATLDRWEVEFAETDRRSEELRVAAAEARVRGAELSKRAARVIRMLERY